MKTIAVSVGSEGWIDLSVNAENQGAHGLYLSVGFTQKGESIVF